jgi:short-subunit dehydrogenase/acyl carrier protein
VEGARHLWIVGRTGAQAAPLIDGLSERVTVRYAALDVADVSLLAQQIAVWEAAGPPLRGVIHAAGATGRTALAQLAWDDVHALARPKVVGTWALAQAVEGRILDFFTCCSSVAALWGGQEQSAYAAANAFLDGLAAYRAARGLPATSIALGPVGGTPMVPDSVAEELRRMGLHTIPLNRAAGDLRRLLAAARPHVALVTGDLQRFAMLHSARSPSSLFTELAGPRPAASETTPPSERIEDADAIRSWLIEQVAAALHLPVPLIDPALPLPQLGLDSLTAMELRNRVQARLGITVPLPDLLGGHGLGSLATRLATIAAAAATPPRQSDVAVWIAGEI